MTRLNVPVAHVLSDHREVFEITKDHYKKKMENTFYVGSINNVL